MRRISTGIEQLLTSAAVATAVLTYARALALAGTADTVTIPIVRDDGGLDHARLLLGPSSQLTDVPDGDADVALDDADTVTEIERRTELLGPRPISDEQDPDLEVRSAFPDFDEFD